MMTIVKAPETNTENEGKGGRKQTEARIPESPSEERSGELSYC